MRLTSHELEHIETRNSYRPRALRIVCGARRRRPLAARTVTVVAHDAWAREPVPSRDVTALFVVLENRGATARAVVSGESDAAAKVELHEMKMDAP